jgi:hypothetical protein
MIEINKIIEREVYRKAFIYEIQMDVDDKYFKEEIENCLKKKNLYYTTNVKGKMTEWDAFNKNEKFVKILTKGLKYVSQFHQIKPRVIIESAWGIKIEKGDYTEKHNHSSSELSGILYLNDVSQLLIFPDLNISVKPKKGTFLIFSPWLEHFTGLNESDVAKYAIAFNFREFKNKNWS